MKNDYATKYDKFIDVYPNYDLDLLPSYVKENIREAVVTGKRKRCIILPDGRRFNMDNKLNDFGGVEWCQFINSVVVTTYSTRGKESYAHEIRKKHPSPKPPQLMKEIIQFFTKENEVVLDTFMGAGSTLIGAALCKRKAVGIDLSSDYINLYKEACDKLHIDKFDTYCGDCIEILENNCSLKEKLAQNPPSLLLIDPPYFDMMSRKKTGGNIAKYGAEGTPFTLSEKDLGNMSKTDFFNNLKLSIEKSLVFIKEKGYVVIFIKDLQPKIKEINMLHYEVVNCLNNIPNLFYKGMKIWADMTCKLYPYGYPFSFVANQIHQYILIFRKETI